MRGAAGLIFIKSRSSSACVKGELVNEMSFVGGSPSV